LYRTKHMWPDGGRRNAESGTPIRVFDRISPSARHDRF
jgi:hypothetical protein